MPKQLNFDMNPDNSADQVPLLNAVHKTQPHLFLAKSFPFLQIFTYITVDAEIHQTCLYRSRDHWRSILISTFQIQEQDKNTHTYLYIYICDVYVYIYTYGDVILNIGCGYMGKVGSRQAGRYRSVGR